MNILPSKKLDAFFNRCLDHIQQDHKADFLAYHVTKANERKVQKLLNEANFAEFQGPKKQWPSLFLSTKEWENNPYHQQVHLDYVKDDYFSFKKEKTAGFELFNSDEIQKDPHRELNDWMKLRAMDQHFETLYLYQDDKDWMVDAPSEYNTNYHPSQKAHGKVLTFGLGIGYFLWFVLDNPTVEEVTVIEKNEAVLSMFQRFIYPQFPQKKKVHFLLGNAFDYFQESYLKNFDYVYTDIWKSTNDGLFLIEKLLEQMDLPLEKGDFWIEESCYEMMWTLSFWYFYSLYTGDPFQVNEKYQGLYKKIQLYYNQINETLDEEKIKFYIYDTQTIRHILHQQR